MTLLSRKADYALLILSHLNQRAEGGNAREIAEQFNLSRPFVANILKELCHLGYVVSHRGVKGGYTLHPSTAAVSFARLLETIEDGFRLTVCSPELPHNDDCGLEHSCPVKGPLGKIHTKIMDVLRGVTLGELFPLADDPATAPQSLLSLLPLRVPAGEPLSNPASSN